MLNKNPLYLLTFSFIVLLILLKNLHCGEIKFSVTQKAYNNKCCLERARNIFSVVILSPARWTDLGGDKIETPPVSWIFDIW